MIQPWVRPARFVLEHTPLHEILATIQRTGQELVIVVDEFGGTAGLLTLRDLTTEIIGEVHVPNRQVAGLVQRLDETTYRVRAQVDLDRVNQLLGLELPYSDDYQTLGGFLIDQMQKIPQPGETCTYGGYQWTVLSTQGPKLQDIVIKKLENP